MRASRPYQPLLFRLLHGLTGGFAIVALLTAFWTYNTYDGRWGTLPLPRFEAIEGIHGTFGLYTLLIFPVFVVYACRRGQRRLVQPDSMAQLTQLDRPAGRYALHRLTNTIALLALTFALFSGKMMSERWLPNGELDHGWYYAHLLSWVVLVACVALHLLMSVRVGGAPLLLSVLEWRFRPQDHPARWSKQVSHWWRQQSPVAVQAWLQSPSLMKVLEVALLTSIAAAWLISLSKELT